MCQWGSLQVLCSSSPLNSNRTVRTIGTNLTVPQSIRRAEIKFTHYRVQQTPIGAEQSLSSFRDCIVPQRNAHSFSANQRVRVSAGEDRYRQVLDGATRGERSVCSCGAHACWQSTNNSARWPVLRWLEVTWDRKQSLRSRNRALTSLRAVRSVDCTTSRTHNFARVKCSRWTHSRAFLALEAQPLCAYKVGLAHRAPLVSCYCTEIKAFITSKSLSQFMLESLCYY